MNNDFSLEQLASRAEIEYRVLSFCRGVDRKDKELARSAFHPDGTDDHGGYSGPVDGLLDWIWERHKNLPICFHHVGSISIDLVNDHEAMCESYCITCISAEDGSNTTAKSEKITFNRYVDYFTRRDGSWRIQTRKTILESWMPIPNSPNPLPAQGVKATRDTQDYSYTLRKKLGLI